MASNAIFFAWNRSIAGRERISAEHFQHFVRYLGEQQQKGTIASFDPVFLDPHGGDMNGLFLIRGDSAKPDALMASDERVTNMTRVLLHLEGSGAVRGVAGEMVMARMAVWTKLLPT